MGWHILLVEDDEDLVATLQEVLADEGHVVLTAATGDAAVEAASHGPTVAFVDLHIEGQLTGRDLITRLRETLPTGARLYLLSGERDLADRAREMGADGWLEKPFGVEDLLALLEEQAGAPDHEPHAPSPH